MAYVIQGSFEDIKKLTMCTVTFQVENLEVLELNFKRFGQLT